MKLNELLGPAEGAGVGLIGPVDCAGGRCAPFVTGGANPPLASRGSGSLVTGFGPGVGKVLGSGESVLLLFWF